MPATLTVNLTRPIAALRIEAANEISPPTESDPNGNAQAAWQDDPCEPSESPVEVQANQQQQEEELAQLCQLLEAAAAKLETLYDQCVVQHRADIANLAVEIARKVLADRINKGDYDVRPIIEEALKRSPTQQDITIRINPADLPACQQLQQDNRDGHFAELNFVADWSINPADCLIETPKGIVKSFVEDHLTRIVEALERAQQS